LCQLVQRDVLGQMRGEIVADPAHGVMLAPKRRRYRALGGVAREQLSIGPDQA
jgi:hypothetical protein